VEVDHDEASALGLTAAQVSEALYSAYGTRQISPIYAPNNEYYVIVELLPEFQNNPEKLSLLYVRSSVAKLVPLDTVAKLVPSIGPLTVNHLGQLPSATISFNLKPETALGDATKLVEREALRVLPGEIQGTFQEPRKPFRVPSPAWVCFCSPRFW
jgi:HAE1 family hydrophobic/amphiphilic exporter-1